MVGVGRGMQNGLRFSKRVFITGLAEKETFKQPERSEGVSHVCIWGKSIPGRGNNLCKGPRPGGCKLRLRKSQEARWLVQRLPEKGGKPY